MSRGGLIPGVAELLGRLRERLQRDLGILTFVLLFALGNLLLYHRPLYDFAVSNLDPWSFNGVVTLLVVAALLFGVTVAILLWCFTLARWCGLMICMIIAVGNSLALFFISSYQVILDKEMMANVLNTRYSEASEFVDTGILVYLLLFGIVPCWLLLQPRLRSGSRLWLPLQGLIALVLGFGSFAAAPNTWLWIDEHSRYLGGMMLPWAYVGNGIRQLNLLEETVDDQLLLPPATVTDEAPLLAVLVIGETARAANFAFYGYERDTNPASSAAGIFALADARACTTYTTASIRCMLSHAEETGPFAKNHEVLPTYLQRHGIHVIWRSNNWGEPPIRVASYRSAGALRKTCEKNCKYDEVLLAGLADEIRAAQNDRILVVLHQKGSHGPVYSKRYPPEFEKFRPVCRSVELQDCSTQELVNAFDNTILYTDYFLARVVEVLGQFDDRPSLMLYLSDHGESLGEGGLYLHGMPYAIAPDVQKNIPFLVWLSDAFVERSGVSIERMKARTPHSQGNVFHSLISVFGMHSEVYHKNLDIFSPNFGDPTGNVPQ